MEIVGVLLAAGRGRRFDPAGVQNKLLQPLADGDLVAATSARKLLAACGRVLAVVRPDDGAVTQLLRGLGCEVSVCIDADQGMGASVAHALRHTQEADGWLIALADMPYVAPSTLAALSAALAAGADIALPLHAGRRGNPVGFSRRHLGRLLALTGDQGARHIVQAWPVTQVLVDDPGILRDIDTPQDL